MNTVKLVLLLVCSAVVFGCSRAEVKDFVKDSAVDGTKRVLEKHADE